MMRDTAWISKEQELWHIVHGSLRRRLQRIPPPNGCNSKVRTKILERNRKMREKWDSAEKRALQDFLLH